jgi:hypothetical protein
MKISPDVMILVGGLAAAAFLVAQDSHQEWRMSPGSSPDTVRFEIDRKAPGNRMMTSGDFALADFQGLNLNANGTTHFEYVQDAGTLLCTGRVWLGRGSGTFVVQPNPRFADRMEELGYGRPTPEQVWVMLLTRVSLEYARGVHDAGLNVSMGRLIDLRNQGVTLSYLHKMLGAFPGLSAEDMLNLKVQGVTPEFVEELKLAGYDLPASRIVDLKVQGVSPSYVRSLKSYGLKPGPEDLLQFKVQGVTPEYLKSMKDAGATSLDRHQIIDLKVQGVSPEFVRTANELGYKFSVPELINLKVQGVTSGYLRRLNESGMRTLTASQIVKLKIHGIE